MTVSARAYPELQWKMLKKQSGPAPRSQHVTLEDWLEDKHWETGPTYDQSFSFVGPDSRPRVFATITDNDSESHNHNKNSQQQKIKVIVTMSMQRPYSVELSRFFFLFCCCVSTQSDTYSVFLVSVADRFVWFQSGCLPRLQRSHPRFNSSWAL